MISHNEADKPSYQTAKNNNKVHVIPGVTWAK